jgi:anti-anti-sigma factor
MTIRARQIPDSSTHPSQFGEPPVEQRGPTYEFEQHADYCVLALKPAMNDVQWGEIEKVGDEVVKQIETLRSPHLIADLSELDYIGSSMVALVVRIWKIIKAKNARMVVVNRNPMVLEVFKISKLDEVWTITEFREDALYELGVSPEAKTERLESNLLAVASLLIALVGAAGLGLHWANPGLLADRVTQVLAYGCSGLGMLLGLLLLFKGEGGRRAIGILAMIVGVLVFWGAVFTVPFNTEAEPEAPQAETDSDAKEKAKTSRASEKESKTKTGQPAVAEKPEPADM